MLDPDEIEHLYKKAEEQSECARIRKQKEQTEQKARQKYHDGLSPDELARRLRSRCNLNGLETLKDLEKRLLDQALTLDSSFFVSMHQAGLGKKSSLSPEALNMALQSQRLCRQTFSTLKESQKSENKLKNDEKSK
ncbi:MAG: hypothetical protein H6859_09660 [Rhodospirillales bacterium]|nr:MAG: hypothetical protein H6859_09660 [Rhodospirillales bacterium]